MNKLILVLKHYDNKYLNKLIDNIFELIVSFGGSDTAFLVSKITFPKKDSKITVLRSPHVYKKSREQFLSREYRIGLLVQNKDFNRLVKIYKFLNVFVKHLNCSYKIQFYK